MITRLGPKKQENLKKYVPSSGPINIKIIIKLLLDLFKYKYKNLFNIRGGIKIIDKKLILQLIENLTIRELIDILNQKSLIEEKKNNVKTIYTTDELINNYNIFTRYNINKAIREKDLPYFSIGNKKFFEKEEIDKWIQSQKTGGSL